MQAKSLASCCAETMRSCCTDRRFCYRRRSSGRGRRFRISPAGSPRLDPLAAHGHVATTALPALPSLDLRLPTVAWGRCHDFQVPSPPSQELGISVTTQGFHSVKFFRSQWQVTRPREGRPCLRSARLDNSTRRRLRRARRKWGPITRVRRRQEELSESGRRSAWHQYRRNQRRAASGTLGKMSCLENELHLRRMAPWPSHRIVVYTEAMSILSPKPRGTA